MSAPRFAEQEWKRSRLSHQKHCLGAASCKSNDVANGLNLNHLRHSLSVVFGVSILDDDPGDSGSTDREILILPPSHVPDSTAGHTVEVKKFGDRLIGGGVAEVTSLSHLERKVELGIAPNSTHL